MRLPVFTVLAGLVLTVAPAPWMLAQEARPPGPPATNRADAQRELRRAAIVLEEQGLHDEANRLREVLRSLADEAEGPAGRRGPQGARTPPPADAPPPPAGPRFGRQDAPREPGVGRPAPGDLLRAVARMRETLGQVVEIDRHEAWLDRSAGAIEADREMEDDRRARLERMLELRRELIALEKQDFMASLRASMAADLDAVESARDQFRGDGGGQIGPVDRVAALREILEELPEDAVDAFDALREELRARGLVGRFPEGAPANGPFRRGGHTGPGLGMVPPGADGALRDRFPAGAPGRDATHVQRLRRELEALQDRQERLYREIEGLRENRE